MSYIDDKRYVLEHIDKRTLLEQLAEEAAELSQAALKLIRAESFPTIQHRPMYQLHRSS